MEIKPTTMMALPPKKICIVTLEYPPDQWGGLARTVETVARHAREMGLYVHVAHISILKDATILLDENRRDEVRDGIRVHRLQVGTETLSNRPLGIWDFPHTRPFKMMYQSLQRLQDREAFDLFHGFFLYPIGYITGLLAKRVRVPSVLTIVGNDVNKYLFSPEAAAFCRSGLENADRVVGLSDDLLKTADALSPVRHKGRVIYNSVQLPPVYWEPRALRPELSQSESFRIGCAGIFKYAKGLPYLFKAVQALRRRHDILLELVGTLRDSEKDTYLTMIDRTGIADRVRFQPALPHDRMAEWLLSLDAFVLPSVSEGCPNILMEAMACGLPCVATRVGAVEDLMEDGESGLIVPWADGNALAEAIERIMGLPDRGLALGRSAADRMKAFSPERERRNWEALYAEIF